MNEDVAKGYSNIGIAKNLFGKYETGGSGFLERNGIEYLGDGVLAELEWKPIAENKPATLIKGIDTSHYAKFDCEELTKTLEVV